MSARQVSTHRRSQTKIQSQGPLSKRDQRLASTSATGAKYVGRVPTPCELLPLADADRVTHPTAPTPATRTTASSMPCSSQYRSSAVAIAQDITSLTQGCTNLLLVLERSLCTFGPCTSIHDCHNNQTS